MLCLQHCNRQIRRQSQNHQMHRLRLAVGMDKMCVECERDVIAFLLDDFVDSAHF